MSYCSKCRRQIPWYCYLALLLWSIVTQLSSWTENFTAKLICPSSVTWPTPQVSCPSSITWPTPQVSCFRHLTNTSSVMLLSCCRHVFRCQILQEVADNSVTPKPWGEVGRCTSQILPEAQVWHWWLLALSDPSVGGNILPRLRHLQDGSWQWFLCCGWFWAEVGCVRFVWGEGLGWATHRLARPEVGCITFVRGEGLGWPAYKLACPEFLRDWPWRWCYSIFRSGFVSEMRWMSGGLRMRAVHRSALIFTCLMIVEPVFPWKWCDRSASQVFTCLKAHVPTLQDGFWQCCYCFGFLATEGKGGVWGGGVDKWCISCFRLLRHGFQLWCLLLTEWWILIGK